MPSLTCYMVHVCTLISLLQIYESTSVYTPTGLKAHVCVFMCMNATKEPFLN